MVCRFAIVDCLVSLVSCTYFPCVSYVSLWLVVTGTLRPDLIESASELASGKAEMIKTHHNDTELVRQLRKQVMPPSVEPTSHVITSDFMRMILSGSFEIGAVLTYLLFLWLFRSCRVAGITDDLSSPHRPVRLLTRSQSSTFQISLTRVFPSCFRSSYLPFPWYIRPQHFPQYVLAISPHHMPVPVQSSLSDLFGSLRHSCCSSDVFIPDLVFACHSAHPS